MAQPLMAAEDDDPLVRPKVVDDQIDAVFKLAPAALRARLAIGDRRNPDHLRSETLVHLVRHGRRVGDQILIGLVLPVLLARCEANLLIKVPDGQLPGAASLREDILGAFSELFANDGRGDNPDELNFYECRFNLAFKFFRIDMVRRESARLRPIAPMPEPDEDGEPGSYDEVFARVSEAFRSEPTQERELVLSELHDAIRELPADEQVAVILVHALGYQEESDDPKTVTAATLCDCTGRTIRNRLTRAAAKLARFKEAL
jgi:uncharacterized protein (DUF2267 family)